MTADSFCGQCLLSDISVKGSGKRNAQRVSLYCSQTCGSRGGGRGGMTDYDEKTFSLASKSTLSITTNNIIRC